MNLRNLLATHHLPEEESMDGGGGEAPSGNPVNTAGRLHIQEAPPAFARVYRAYTPYVPVSPDKQITDNERENLAINKIFQHVREASNKPNQGSPESENDAKNYIRNRVLTNLDGFDIKSLKPKELELITDYLYKNRNYTVDESGNFLPWENAQSDVRNRQNRKEGIIHAAPERPAEGTGVNTEHTGRSKLQY